jgi:hypothetical protein
MRFALASFHKLHKSLLYKYIIAGVTKKNVGNAKGAPAHSKTLARNSGTHRVATVLIKQL